MVTVPPTTGIVAGSTELTMGPSATTIGVGLVTPHGDTSSRACSPGSSTGTTTSILSHNRPTMSSGEPSSRTSVTNEAPAT